MATDDTKLLNDFAPVVKLDSREEYFPSSVPWYLGKVALLNEDGVILANPVLQQGATDTSFLAGTDYAERSRCRLEIQDYERWSKSQTMAGEPLADGKTVTAEVYGYVHDVVDQHGALIGRDLNYWFFYPFNGNVFDMGMLILYLMLGSGVTLAPGLGLAAVIALVRTWNGVDKHEGDWERVTVRLDLHNNVKDVYVESHGDGSWRSSYERYGDTQRPVVYAARSSHGTYFSPGSYSRYGGLATDHANGAGAVWDAKGRVVDVGDPAGRMKPGVAWVGPATVPMSSQPSNVSVAANFEGYLVVAYQDDSDYKYVAGRLLESGALDFDSVEGSFQLGTGGPPSIALGSSGRLIAVSRCDGSLRYDFGYLRAEQGTLEFVSQGSGSGGSSYGDPKVAMVGDTFVIVDESQRVYDGDPRCWYRVGKVGDGGITWLTGADGNFYANGRSPAVALTEDRVVVVCQVRHLGDDPELVYSCGYLAEDTDGIAWSAQTVTVPGATAVALSSLTVSSGGFVVAVYQCKGGALECSTGRLVNNRDQGGGIWIDWNDTPGARYADSHQAPSVTAVGETFIEAHVPSDTGELPVCCYLLGRVVDGSYGDWRPRNDQAWFKYPGRWGRKGTEPLFWFDWVPLVGGLAEFQDGPEGPSLHDAPENSPQDLVVAGPLFGGWQAPLAPAMAAMTVYGSGHQTVFMLLPGKGDLVYASTSTDGAVWSSPQQLRSGWRASLAPSAVATVRRGSPDMEMMFAVLSDSSQRVFISLTGDGESWSEPQPLFNGWQAPLPPSICAMSPEVGSHARVPALFMLVPGKPNEGNVPTVNISRSEDGIQWSSPQQLFPSRKTPLAPSMAVMAPRATGKPTLFMVLPVPADDHRGTKVYISHSEDGESWSDPRGPLFNGWQTPLAPSIAAMTPRWTNVPTLFMLVPGYAQNGAVATVNLSRSEDGENWSKPEPLFPGWVSPLPPSIVSFTPAGTKTPTLLILLPGIDGTLYTSSSTDGVTWTPPSPQ